MSNYSRFSVLRKVHFKGEEIVRVDGKVVIARENIKVQYPPLKKPERPQP